MKRERELSNISALMVQLNLAIILFYSLICCVTVFRICASFGAYDFLASVQKLPPYPWSMPVWSVCVYLALIVLSYAKFKWNVEQFKYRLLICVAEMILCVWVITALDFYYSGVALLVLADLVHYVQNGRIRLCFIAILTGIFAFGRGEILFPTADRIEFVAYLSYYSQPVRRCFASMESLMVSCNVLLFVLYMILLFTGQKAENARIRALNSQLNEANAQLRDYAVKLERMTEIRERNRLAREIHDTLGHTLTGIIMGTDAGLALFDAAPEEAKKRMEVVAQAARNGLNDVRRSIKALRPDALEQVTLGEALATLIENFHMTTSVEIRYDQQAGPLLFAQDEEDTLYRIIQESMTNAVRHGHATEIDIRLTRQTDMLTVDVRDNGLGSEQVEEGFGLRHMQERLGLLGGSLTYGNRAELEEDGQRGFFLVASLPIRGREKKFL